MDGVVPRAVGGVEAVDVDEAVDEAMVESQEGEGRRIDAKEVRKDAHNLWKHRFKSLRLRGGLMGRAMLTAAKVEVRGATGVKPAKARRTKRGGVDHASDRDAPRLSREQRDLARTNGDAINHPRVIARKTLDTTTMVVNKDPIK